MTYIYAPAGLFPGRPGLQLQRLKNNDYIADMTYIFAPGPGLVCHHVLKYQVGMTNKRSAAAAAAAPWGAYLVASSRYDLLG